MASGGVIWFAKHHLLKLLDRPLLSRALLAGLPEFATPPFFRLQGRITHAATCHADDLLPGFPSGDIYDDDFIIYARRWKAFHDYGHDFRPGPMALISPLSTKRTARRLRRKHYH